MKKYLYLPLAALMGFLLAACNSDEDYQRAGEPAASDEGIYFPTSNPSEYIRTESDAKTIDVTIARHNTEGELTVPVQVVSRTQNIGKVPDHVTFADGAATATLTVPFTDLSVTPKCTLEIPEDYTNPYLIKEGSTKFSFCIYKLVIVSDQINYITSAGTAYFDKVYTSELLQYEGENKFIWRNFFGSGIDLKFKINGHFDPQDVYACYGEVTPLDHAQGDSDGWTLLDDDGNELSWTPEGCDTAVDALYSWLTYNGYVYFNIDLRKNEQGTQAYGYARNESAYINEDYNTCWVYFYY